MESSFFEDLGQYDDLREHQKLRYERLLNTCLLISKIFSVDHILSEIIKQAIRLSGAERGFLIIRKNGTFEYKINYDREGKDIPYPENEVSASIINRVIKSCDTVLYDNAQTEMEAPSDSIIDLRLRSVLCLPIVKGENTEGVIYLDNRTKEGRFTEDDLYFLTIFSNFAAILLNNTSLVEKLTVSEKKLETLLESVSDPIITMDEKGVITFINNAGKEFFGIDAECLTGKPFADFIHPGDKDMFSNFLDIGESGGREKLDFRGISAMDEILHLSMHCSKMKDPDGKANTIGVVRDMTGEVNRELKNEQLLRNLENEVVKQTDDKHVMQKWLLHLFKLSSRLYLLEGTDKKLNLTCRAVSDAGIFKKVRIALWNDNGELTNLKGCGSHSDGQVLSAKSKRNFSKKEQRLYLENWQKLKSELENTNEEDGMKGGIEYPLRIPLIDLKGNIFGILEAGAPSKKIWNETEAARMLECFVSHLSVTLEKDRLQKEKNRLET